MKNTSQAYNGRTGDFVQRDTARAKLEHEHAKVTPVPRAHIDDDPEVTERVKFSMLENESLGEWYVRSGLGRFQILSMTEQQIASHISRVAANSVDDPNANPAPWRMRKVPAHFTLD